MTHARAIVLSVLGSAVFLSFFGCADPEPTSNEGVVPNVEPKVTPRWSPTLSGGVCPDKALGSTEPPEWYQARATSVIQYVVGGKDPFDPAEVSSNPACKDAWVNATKLRDMISPPSSKTAPTATLQAAFADKVCGLPAALYRIDISSQVPASVWDEQRKTGDLLDKCWGVGVSGFYYADPTQDKYRRIYIDPEPARLTADLSGSTGATAAAVYTNTGTGTTVRKWPGTYISTASPPTPGQPCSTSDLANGSETLKILQGSGTWRRCY